MAGFPHRSAAGEILADLVAAKGYPNPAVVAIPKGGVPVAAPLTRRIGLPMELCLVAKVPLHLKHGAGIGALASDGTLLLNHDLIHVLALGEVEVEQAVEYAQEAMARRKEVFRAFAHPPLLEGKTAIVLDDGLATGYTALAAVGFVRSLGPARIVVAAPVGSVYALEALSEAGVEVVVLTSGDDPCFDVAAYYDDFEELEDFQVLRLFEAELQRTRTAT